MQMSRARRAATGEEGNQMAFATQVLICAAAASFAAWLVALWREHRPLARTVRAFRGGSSARKTVALVAAVMLAVPFATADDLGSIVALAIDACNSREMLLEASFTNRVELFRNETTNMEERCAADLALAVSAMQRYDEYGDIRSFDLSAAAIWTWSRRSGFSLRLNWRGGEGWRKSARTPTPFQNLRWLFSRRRRSDYVAARESCVCRFRPDKPPGCRRVRPPGGSGVASRTLSVRAGVALGVRSHERAQPHVLALELVLADVALAK